MRKVLIIYSSIGLGHKVVAENIASELKKRDVLEVEMLDILEFYGGNLVSGYSHLYEEVVRKLPWLWRFFYTNQVFTWLTLPLRGVLARWKAEKLQKFLERKKPDLILTTQTTASALVSYLKQTKKYKGKFVVTFSDYHFHPYWVYPAVDFFLLNISEQRAGIKKYGYPKEKSAVVGLPTSDIFFKEYDRSEVLKKYHLTNSKPVVLVMGGSRGWGINKRDVAEILKTDFDIQAVVLCGTNKPLFDSLQELEKGGKNIKALQSIRNEEVARLYSAAHILISKPGGLTSAQAVAAMLPMVMINPFPGMEEQNQKYLETRGVAVAADNPEEMLSWMERMLADPEFYRQLKKNISKFRQPNASKDAAETIIDLLEEGD